MATSNYLSKPPAGAQINWSHPLAQDLAIAWLPVSGQRIYNVCTGKPAIWQNTTTVPTSGNNIRFPAVGQDWFLDREGPTITGKAWTYSSGSSKIIASGNGIIMGYNEAGVTNVNNGFRYDTNTSMTLFYYFNGGNVTIPSIADGRFSAASVVFPKTGVLEGWEGGVLRGTYSSGITNFTGTTREWLLGGGPAVGNGAQFVSHYAYVHVRALTRPEIEWLTAEPYCFFYVPVARKYWIPGLVPPPSADGVLSIPNYSVPAQPLIKVVSY